MTTFITLFVVAIAAFVYMLVKLVAGLRARRRFHETAVATQATVLSVTGHMMGYPNCQRGNFGYSPRLRFTTEQGRVYEVQIEPDPFLKHLERGDTVTVQYDRHEPTSAVITGLGFWRSDSLVIYTILTGVTAAGLAGLLVLGAAMFLLFGGVL